MHIRPSLLTNPTPGQLRADYRVTNGYCMELYHVISGPGVLTLKARGEDYIERDIASVISDNKVPLSFQGMFNLKANN